MNEPYVVVRFANGKYGVRRRSDGHFSSAAGIFSHLIGGALWWYYPSNVKQYCMTSERRAKKICKRLNAKVTDWLSKERQAREDAVVVETISCG